MKCKDGILSVLVIFFMVGCAVQNSNIEKRGVLDESLYYYELDNGEKRGISDDKVNAQTRDPQHVPHPALVDINSQIQILIAKDRLSPKGGQSLFDGRSDGLLVRKQSIQSALASLEHVVDARRSAIEAFNSNTSLENFEKARRAFGKAEEKFIEELLELFPNEPEASTIEEAYDPIRDPSLKGLQSFLQSQINSLEREDHTIASNVSNRQVSLRLEAFLSSPDPRKDPISVHLDGYDSIRQGEFRQHDRLGLNLSKEERQQLEAQIQATNNTVAIAERVRKKEVLLQDAVKDSIRLVSPQLGEIIPEIENFLPKLKTNTLKQRLNQTGSILKEFVGEVKTQGSNVGVDFGSQLKQIPRELQTAVRNDLDKQPIVKTLESLAKAKTLFTRWSTVRSVDSTLLILDSVNFLSDFEQTVQSFTILAENELGNLTPEVRTLLQRLLQEKFAGLQAETKNMLLQVAEGSQGQALREDLGSYYKDLNSLLEISKKVIQGLNVVRGTVAVGTRAPESLNVPLEKVKDTFIDLTYTPRVLGDTITVRATLSKGEEEEVLDKTTASFQVSQFGHYGKLSPAVVLVKPTELKGGSDDFQFSPILSWMAHYAPRPQESGVWIGAQRALKGAIGIHSALLHFDGTDSDAVQIGLGGTISFWENRLQFGGGLNLMADSVDDGLIYYFVGTDLIGILQTLQSTTGIGN